MKSISIQSGCYLRRKLYVQTDLEQSLRMWAQEATETDGKPAQHWTQILDDYFSSTALCWYEGMSQTLKNPPLSLVFSLSFSLWVFIRTDERHAPFQPRSQRSPQLHSVSLLFLCFRRDHEFLICPKGPFWSFSVSGLWRFTNEGLFSPSTLSPLSSSGCVKDFNTPPT